MTSAIATTPHPIRLYAQLDIAVSLHFLGAPPEGIQAKIYRVSSGITELASPVYLPQNQRLEMVCQEQRIEARVAYCRRETSTNYDLAVRMGPDNQRRMETRIPVDLATRLQVLGSPGTIPGRVVDLSPSGVGMDLSQPIPVGARVAVGLGYATALGEIRHCAAKGSVYRAGMRLEKLVRRNDTNAPIWTDLNSGSNNAAALAAFTRSIEENQLRSEAVLLSLARPVKTR